MIISGSAREAAAPELCRARCEGRCKARSQAGDVAIRLIPPPPTNSLLFRVHALASPTGIHRVSPSPPVFFLFVSRPYVLNRYSRIPVAQPQEYKYRIPPGYPCRGGVNPNPESHTDRSTCTAHAQMPTPFLSLFRVASLPPTGIRSLPPISLLPFSCRLAFTRYCHCQYCMVYGIDTGGRVGVVYCALVVQWYSNSVSKADGGDNTRMID